MKGLSTRVVSAQDAPHVPTSRTRALVASMSACGLNEAEVAYCLQIGVHLLRETYKDEMEKGLALVTAKLGRSLIRQGIHGDVNAIKFFLMTRAQWVAPTRVEHTGKDGGPVQVEVRRKLMDSILDIARRVRPSEEAAAPKPAAAPPATGVH